MDLYTLLLIGLVVLLTSISKSAFAGALGVFSVPLLMLVMPAAQAIALILPILLIADVMTVKSYWQKWDKGLILSLVPGALVGITIAHFTIHSISPEVLGLLIGFLCILFSLKNLLLKQTRITALNNAFGTWLMSGFSGLSSTLVHAGGPPLLIYFSAIGLSPKQFVASAAIFYALMNVVKLVGFVSLGLLNVDLIIMAAAFVPLSILGNWLGVKIHGRLDVVAFMKVMNILLLVLGSYLIVRSV